MAVIGNLLPHDFFSTSAGFRSCKLLGTKQDELWYWASTFRQPMANCAVSPDTQISALTRVDRGLTSLTSVAVLINAFIMRAAEILDGKYCESELPRSWGVNVPASAFL